MSKKLSFLLLFVMLASLFLAACGPPQTVIVKETQVVAGPTSVVKETAIVEQTAIVKETSEVIVEPTAEPVSRVGAWVDSVILVEEPNTAAGVTRLESGELDLYAYTLSDPELFNRVQEAENLDYSMSYGSYNELTFNVVGPILTATNTLNPFGSRKVREAMNILIDRNYIVQEIFGGLAVARYVAFGSACPDYAKNADLIRAIEIEYAYNPEKAEEIISTEMTAMGATMEDGKWTYNGEPVTIIFLIRVEDARLQIGDYVANQLESIGFTVDRQYKTSAEASALWVRSNPAEGLWHLYTGGWVTTAISRDEGGNFSFFYTDQGYPVPLWAAYENSPEFYEVCGKLLNNDFTTLEERTELIRQAIDMSLEDANRVWLNDRISLTPFRSDIEVSADLSGAVYGSSLWAHTLRRKGQVGGSITIGTAGIMTDPWNPVAGTNWVYDMMPMRATGDAATVADPYTGLPLPMRIEAVDVVAQEGLPIGSDWVNLSFAPSIEVPGDVWAGWDPVNQVFLTADEVYTQTQTARSKCTTYYPEDLGAWHDGSPITVGDFLLNMILQFDRGMEDSLIYDESYAPDLAQFMSHFKGFKIVSTDPLVIETYDDYWSLDAEYMIWSWYPYYDYGIGSWHALAPALMAEEENLLAFSSPKADALEIEWMSFIAGPSMEILNNKLISATEELYIPYAATMGEYVTEDEAATRYANLAEWFRTKGHFWVGNGPMYLERAFPLEGTVLLRRYINYPFMADRWDRFSEARVATVDVSGADSVTIGNEATFDVAITFMGEPYAIADVEQVKYLIVDAKGQLAYVGQAEAVEDGLWLVTVPADVTNGLEAGSNRLEIAVVLKPVALPAFGSLQFVTAP